MERLPGVKRADVKLETGQARIIYDDQTQTPEKPAAAIGKLGYKASVLWVAEAPATGGTGEALTERERRRLRTHVRPPPRSRLFASNSSLSISPRA